VVATRDTSFSSSRFFADTVPRPWHVSHRMIVGLPSLKANRMSTEFPHHKLQANVVTG
jgi:hypothetical protein